MKENGKEKEKGNGTLSVNLVLQVLFFTFSSFTQWKRESPRKDV